MRIGIVTTWFERGASYVSRQYMNILQKTDEVFIYARGGEKSGKNDPKWDLPNVHWAPRDWADWSIYGSTFIKKRDFKRWIDENRIELVFFNEQQVFMPLLWCKQWKVKTAAYIDYYTETLIPLYDIYDCLICNTKRHAFAFRDNPRAHYLKWGTDINLYTPGVDKHEKVTFFNSAGMDPYRKGADHVISAFYRLKDRQKARLIIHAQVSLATVFPNLKSVIDELAGEGSLVVIEKTVSAPGLYYMADVYVYPSRLDGIGLTLMEAASSGLACITIDNAPMNEFIERDFGRVCKVDYYFCREDGYYWPLAVADIDSLASLMQGFVDGREDLAEMKVKARDYAERELDFNKNMSVLHDVLEGVRYQYDKAAYDAVYRHEYTRERRMRKFLHPLLNLYFFLNKKARQFE
ncbi:MAG: glycosyltransferase family 4 protein [Bacteroidales bacterium]|nr:glycosyltransferase family 4 protein [Bacteroidales bacterium]